MKRLMMLMILLLAIVACSSVMADDLTDRWGVGITAGFMKPVRGGHDYSSLDPFVGAWARRGLTSHWSIDGGVKFSYWYQGATEIGDDAGMTFSNESEDRTRFFQALLGARYNLKPDSRSNPYLGLQFGYAKWRVVDRDGSNDLDYIVDDDTVVGYLDGMPQKLDTTNFSAALTLGMEYFVGDNTSLDFGARYNWLFDNDLDNIGTSAIWGPDEGDPNTGVVEFFVGGTYYWGGNNDSDNDGIPNGDDACPKVAEDMDGFEDADGCPEADNDHDGILDADDLCPNQAEDMDGFEDADGCPDLDNDGDGVLDVNDKCPNEAEDIDGYMDRDGCPDPDNDGDGVLDAMDQCPDTAPGAEVDANGCAKAVKRDLVLKGVNFRLNSAELTPESSATLNEVAESMTIWDTISIEVAGHTDSTGSAEYNQRLSQARAETVLNFLASKGIARDRMSARGYGEEMPVASNDTAEGRAQNRRVELNRTD